MKFKFLGMVFLLTAFIGCNEAPFEQGEAVESVAINAFVDHRRADWQASHQRMVDELAAVNARTNEEHLYLGNHNANVAKKQLQQLSQGPKSAQMWDWQRKLGEFELRLGNEEDAIQTYLKAYATGFELKDVLPSSAARETLFDLAIAYLRLAETQNCCQRNTPDSCIFPITGTGVHTDQQSAKRAIAIISRILDIEPIGTDLHYKARWLLNLANMTIGTYPQGVPEKWLVPSAAFTSEVQIPKFTNVAANVGVDTFSLSGGVIVDDFNNDDLLDIVVSSYAPWGQLRIFLNAGDGTFKDTTEAAGLTGLFGGLNMVQADFNNDGHTDLFVTRGAWLGIYGQHPNSLLRNNGDGTFTDVTFAAGLGNRHYPTQTAAWADFDLDGDLDLFVGSEHGLVGNAQESQFPCQLFRNNGDETFTDIAASAGVENYRYAKAAVWGDFDNDRWPDLYVSNLNGENRLYHNQADGTFVDVAPRLNVAKPILSFPAWFWDYNNDGRLDLYVSAYDCGIQDLCRYYLGEEVSCELARLYQGTSTGFQDVSSESNIVMPTMPMGSNFGDINNDGYLDFYLGTGSPEYHQLMPNVMYLNQQGQRFADVTTAGGFGHLQKGHGVAFADLDNDGDQDVIEEMGGAYAGDSFYDALFANPGFGNQWIVLHLVGKDSNRSAIGCRIQVDISERGRQRTIHRRVNSGGSFGANPLRQMIGLGEADEILKLQIFWPKTGSIQTVTNPKLNSLNRITEGERVAEIVDTPTFQLGAGAQMTGSRK